MTSFSPSIKREGPDDPRAEKGKVVMRRYFVSTQKTGHPHAKKPVSDICFVFTNKKISFRLSSKFTEDKKLPRVLYPFSYVLLTIGFRRLIQRRRILVSVRGKPIVVQTVNIAVYSDEDPSAPSER
ncbi:hypothetical protein T265_02640 [Opisthorchis viverrini]|uniref:Uncharacterized protein n=1 Tax=Opisthorchis viverrini TaxID=6198 RepID=A0A075AI62_OPIVI|nr:hypothetical protein T265_02640 [Opisthorchis viverrini]KER31079.1 hypothetical protein T265_02640 [Opisthorchis viverrini]